MATFDYSKFLQDTGELERSKFLESIQRNKYRSAREGLEDMSFGFAHNIPGSHGKSRKGYMAGAVAAALATLLFHKKEARQDEENNRRLAMFIAKDREEKEARIQQAHNIFKSDVADERKHDLNKENLRQTGARDLYREKNKNALDIANIHRDAIMKSALAKASSKHSNAILGNPSEGVGLKDLQMASRRISNPNDVMAYLKSNGNLPLEEIQEPTKWLGIPIGKKGTGKFKIAAPKVQKGSRLKAILSATKDSSSPKFQMYARKAKKEYPGIDPEEIKRMYEDYLTQEI